MSSHSLIPCILRHYVIDTLFFTFLYIFLLTMLFIKKERLYATILTITLMVLVMYSVRNCMASIGAFVTIAIDQCIILFEVYVALLILSFLNFKNNYKTYFVMTIILYILFAMQIFNLLVYKMTRPNVQ